MAKLANKFTFKTNLPTGKWKSFGTTEHVVKLDGEGVGNIEDGKPFKVRLQVYKTAEDNAKPNANLNCPWKWITLKHESESLDAAKAYLNENFERILRLNIYPRGLPAELPKKSVTPFEDATDEQLLVCANFCGLDEIKGLEDTVKGSGKLTPEGRKMIIAEMRRAGYTSVDSSNPNMIIAI